MQNPNKQNLDSTPIRALPVSQSNRIIIFEIYLTCNIEIITRFQEKIIFKKLDRAKRS